MIEGSTVRIADRFVVERTRGSLVGSNCISEIYVCRLRKTALSRFRIPLRGHLLATTRSPKRRAVETFGCALASASPRPAEYGSKFVGPFTRTIEIGQMIS